MGKLKLAQEGLQTAIEILSGIDVVSGYYGNAANKVVTQVKEIADMKVVADSLDMSTRNLSEFQYVASTVNLTSKDVNSMLAKVKSTVYSISSGKDKNLSEKLQGLDVNFRELAKQSPEKQVVELVEAINKLNDPSEKTYYSQLFDNNMFRLIPLLNDGGEKLKQLKKDAYDFGYVVDDFSARKVAEAETAFSKMEAVTKGLDRHNVIEDHSGIKGFSEAKLSVYNKYLDVQYPKAKIAHQAYLELESIKDRFDYDAVISTPAGSLSSQIEKERKDIALLEEEIKKHREELIDFERMLSEQNSDSRKEPFRQALESINNLIDNKESSVLEKKESLERLQVELNISESVEVKPSGKVELTVASSAPDNDKPVVERNIYFDSSLNEEFRRNIEEINSTQNQFNSIVSNLNKITDVSLVVESANAVQSELDNSSAIVNNTSDTYVGVKGYSSNQEVSILPDSNDELIKKAKELAREVSQEISAELAAELDKIAPMEQLFSDGGRVNQHVLESVRGLDGASELIDEVLEKYNEYIGDDSVIFDIVNNSGSNIDQRISGLRDVLQGSLSEIVENLDEPLIEFFDNLENDPDQALSVLKDKIRTVLSDAKGDAFAGLIGSVSGIESDLKNAANQLIDDGFIKPVRENVRTGIEGVGSDIRSELLKAINSSDEKYQEFLKSDNSFAKIIVSNSDLEKGLSQLRENFGDGLLSIVNGTEGALVKAVDNFDGDFDKSLSVLVTDIKSVFDQVKDESFGALKDSFSTVFDILGNISGGDAKDALLEPIKNNLKKEIISASTPVLNEVVKGFKGLFSDKSMALTGNVAALKAGDWDGSEVSDISGALVKGFDQLFSSETLERSVGGGLKEGIDNLFGNNELSGSLGRAIEAGFGSLVSGSSLGDSLGAMLSAFSGSRGGQSGSAQLAGNLAALKSGDWSGQSGNSAGYGQAAVAVVGATVSRAQAGDKRGAAGSAIGGAIGSIWGPIGAQIGSALGGAILGQTKKVIGRGFDISIVDKSILEAFSTTTVKKSSLFSSSVKKYKKELRGTTLDIINNGVSDVFTSIDVLANNIGIDLGEFTSDIEVKNGSMKDAMKKVGEEYVRSGFASIEKFQMVGESLVETFSRLSKEIDAIRNGFKNSFYDYQTSSDGYVNYNLPSLEEEYSKEIRARESVLKEHVYIWEQMRDAPTREDDEGRTYIDYSEVDHSFFPDKRMDYRFFKGLGDAIKMLTEEVEESRSRLAGARDELIADFVTRIKDSVVKTKNVDLDNAIGVFQELSTGYFTGFYTDVEQSNILLENYKSSYDRSVEQFNERVDEYKSESDSSDLNGFFDYLDSLDEELDHSSIRGIIEKFDEFNGLSISPELYVEMLNVANEFLKVQNIEEDIKEFGSATSGSVDAIAKSISDTISSFFDPVKKSEEALDSLNLSDKTVIEALDFIKQLDDDQVTDALNSLDITSEAADALVNTLVDEGKRIQAASSDIAESVNKFFNPIDIVQDALSGLGLAGKSVSDVLDDIRGMSEEQIADYMELNEIDPDKGNSFVNVLLDEYQRLQDESERTTQAFQDMSDSVDLSFRPIDAIENALSKVGLAGMSLVRAVDLINEQSPEQLAVAAEDLGLSTEEATEYVNVLTAANTELINSYKNLVDQIDVAVNGDGSDLMANYIKNRLNLSDQSDEAILNWLDQFDSGDLRYGARELGIEYSDAETWINGLINSVAGAQENATNNLQSYFSSVSDWLGRESDAVREAFENQIAAAEEFSNVAKELREYAEKIRLSELSPAGPGERLEQAQESFADLLDKARNDDLEALQKLTASADTYLQESDSYYGRSDDYVSIFDHVATSLEQLGINLDEANRPEDLRTQMENALEGLEKQAASAIVEAAEQNAELDNLSALLADLPEQLNQAVLQMMGGSTIAHLVQAVIDQSSVDTGSSEEPPVYVPPSSGGGSDSGGSNSGGSDSGGSGSTGYTLSQVQARIMDAWDAEGGGSGYDYAVLYDYARRVHQDQSLYGDIGREVALYRRNFLQDRVMSIWNAQGGGAYNPQDFQNYIDRLYADPGEWDDIHQVLSDYRRDYDGSHARGLGRVPFDGYRAQLHKDEMVLPADVSDHIRRSMAPSADRSYDEMLGELKQLRAEVTTLRGEQQQANQTAQRQRDDQQRATESVARASRKAVEVV